MQQRILVWDFPTRVFHWSLAASFAGAYLTAESEQWQVVHLLCGYLLLGLIAFRLIWGVIGSRHARFASFIRGPAAAIAYLRSLVNGKAQHFTGHNPAGAIAIVLLLLLGIGSGITGWMVFNELGGEAFEEVHEVVANAMLVLVAIHIAAVILSSRLHRENLTAAMINGHKTGDAEESIRHGHGIMALLLVIAMAVFGGALTQGKLPALWDPNNVEHATASNHEKSADNDKDGD